MLLHASARPAALENEHVELHWLPSIKYQRLHDACRAMVNLESGAARANSLLNLAHTLHQHCKFKRHLISYTALFTVSEYNGCGQVWYSCNHVFVKCCRAPGSQVEQLGAFRLPGIRATFKSHKSMLLSASHKSEEANSVTKSKVLVALVAAGVSFTLNATAPVWPAHAGLPFRAGVNVERGATAPDFPGNEATGNQVGDNSRVRGAANRGTPLGEAAGGNLVGNHQAIRQASSRGTPPREGRQAPRQGSATETGVRERRGGGEGKSVNLIESGKELASDVASSEGAQEVKKTAGDVAKTAAQTAVTKAAQDFATTQLGVPGVAATAGTQLLTKVLN